MVISVHGLPLLSARILFTSYHVAAPPRVPGNNTCNVMQSYVSHQYVPDVLCSAQPPTGGRSNAMDQPTAEEALKRLEPLVGEWTLEAKPPDGSPWPGEAQATIEWHDSGAHLVQRSTVDMPEAPDGISIMGCDAANGTYFQLYSDERGVCRVYEMSIADGRWELWREGEPFPQRFTATTARPSRVAGRRRRRGGSGISISTSS